MATTLKQDYWNGAVDEWRSLASHVQSIASTATEQIRTLAEKAKETAQNLAQSLSETVASPEPPGDDDPTEPDRTATDKAHHRVHPSASERFQTDDQLDPFPSDQPPAQNDNRADAVEDWVDDWIDTAKETVQTKGQALASDLRSRSKPLMERFKTMGKAVSQSLDTLEQPQTAWGTGQQRPPRPQPSQPQSSQTDTAVSSGQAAPTVVDSGLQDQVSDDWSNDIWSDDNLAADPSVSVSPSDERSEIDPAPWEDWDENHSAGITDAETEGAARADTARANDTTHTPGSAQNTKTPQSDWDTADPWDDWEDPGTDGSVTLGIENEPPHKPEHRDSNQPSSEQDDADDDPWVL